jgi:hypothetical protein
MGGRREGLRLDGAAKELDGAQFVHGLPEVRLNSTPQFAIWHKSNSARRIDQDRAAS